MAETANPLDWQGRTLVDRDGDKVGKVESIYVDDRSSEPSWALVHTGLFGSRSTFVPLQEADTSGDQIQVPFEKDRIKDAPSLDADEELSPEEERRLYDHYGVDYGDGAAAAASEEHTGGAPDSEAESAETPGGHGVAAGGEGPVGEYRPGPAPDRQAGGGDVAAEGGGQRRLRRYTIVTEEVVKEVIPVDDEPAADPEQPDPDRPGSAA